MLAPGMVKGLQAVEVLQETFYFLFERLASILSSSHSLRRASIGASLAAREAG